MTTLRSAPGALLVLLNRGKTSTQTLVFNAQECGAPLACAGTVAGVTQWALAESLCEQTWANEVSRLYASAIQFEHEGDWLGVFVGFLDADASDAPPPIGAAWVDLREAIETLNEGWGPLLGEVRSAFVASAPDEAMRVR